MSAKSAHEGHAATQETILSLLSQVRSRLSTIAWALHGMHTEQEAPNPDDIASVEQLVSETLEGPFSEAVDLVSELLGQGSEESLTRH